MLEMAEQLDDLEATAEGVVIFLYHDGQQLEDGIPSRLVPAHCRVLKQLVAATCHHAGKHSKQELQINLPSVLQGWF